MKRVRVALALLLLSASSAWGGTSAPSALKDLYFGEALYYAFQEDWFDAIARLDTELMQHYGVDEPERDPLHYHVHQAEFSVGDLELAYRMHLRAGRAITAVIEGQVEDPVRNEAIYRMARLYFQKDQPVNAQYAVDRIRGEVPVALRDDLAFLRAQIFMGNGRYPEAAGIFSMIQEVKKLEGFTTYNLGIALIRDGREAEGRVYLDRAGQMESGDTLSQAIRDKANLVLGSKLLEEGNYEKAKQVLDRVRMDGPFSNRALLASGWADASLGRFDRALVPWSILFAREITDASVQEAMLAVPYAYGKLNVYSTAAVMYGRALEHFDTEIEKLAASLRSIRDGQFLRFLVRDEVKQDPRWLFKLRALPQAPETYYLLDLMASHDFQEALKNYLDLEQLRQKLDVWVMDLDAFEEAIAQRRAYYEPLLPLIDREFRRLDSQIRLRLEQRDRIEKRLIAMRVVPRPDYLATADERILLERISSIEQMMTVGGNTASEDAGRRTVRLRGILQWYIHTEYDRRYTDAYKHLHALNDEVEMLRRQYHSFVRTRQAATQSYEGYDDTIQRQRAAIEKSREAVHMAMARHGRLIETMALDELNGRRERLVQLQTKARFAMADSYDRATRNQMHDASTR